MHVLAIQSPGEILVDFQQYWYIYFSMPVVAAVIGYLTKLLAIEMMFRPLEFVGIKLGPIPLGWQGIIPMQATKMAVIAYDTMIDKKLITPEEIFDRLDSDRIAQEVEAPLRKSIDRIAREVAAQYQPGLWEALPENIRQLIIRRVQDDAPDIVANLMQDIKSDINHVFDLKDMIVTNLQRDKKLINRLFREVGHAEFRFIARSGLYFGFIIGLLQMTVWAVFHNPLIMPVFGLFIGWFTDWLALKLIFYPKQPTRYVGLVEWQGLFLRRRKEVAAAYGELVAAEILTVGHLLEALLRGPLSDRLFAMVSRHVQRVIDEQSGIARPIVVFAVGGTRYQAMKRMIAEKVMEELPETMRHIETYATDAMKIRETMVERMQQLSPEDFEALLRPAFKAEEWKLIAAGAALGFFVGEVQALTVEYITEGVLGFPLNIAVGILHNFFPSVFPPSH